MIEFNQKLDIHSVMDEFWCLLESNDIVSACELFADDCYWRDLLIFTWNIKTMEGKAQIKKMLKTQLSEIKPNGLKILNKMPNFESSKSLAWFQFETEVARGIGIVRLKREKIWTLFTSMIELKSYEEKTRFLRPVGTITGASKNRKTFGQLRHRNVKELGYSVQPYCVVIGGGQGGIAIGARMKQLQVPTLIIEKNNRPGDSWRKRSESLCLHDPVWVNHLPYLKFPENWPIYAPKDKIADWLEFYTNVMELNYWTNTTAVNANYDAKRQNWDLVVSKDGDEVCLNPNHIVIATGLFGKPYIPQIPGNNTFSGKQFHSSNIDETEIYSSKKAVVVGSGNSAFDICMDLWENEVDVTMVQRSSSCVVSSLAMQKHVLGPYYSEEAINAGVSTEIADTYIASAPYRIYSEFQTPLFEDIKNLECDYYSALEKSGLCLDWGENDSGPILKLLQKKPGNYIDTGAGQLIIDGEIKVKHGQIIEVTENGVILEDGSVLETDLIVYATGYYSMDNSVAEIMGQEISSKVGSCWGLVSDMEKDKGKWKGELQNMWKPTNQEGLWFHGGNLQQSRYYSQFLSLQIKARMEKIPMNVYESIV